MAAIFSILLIFQAWEYFAFKMESELLQLLTK